MEIKAADVMKLRKMTGAGMMDCKKALQEAEGDYARAQDIIRERFSISMLEAMSCKKPFIGSNVPGIGDLVRDVALLFEFQDDEELALRIKEVLTDRTLYCNVAEKCYSFAKQYDINIISQKYMKLYRSL